MNSKMLKKLFFFLLLITSINLVRSQEVKKDTVATKSDTLLSKQDSILPKEEKRWNMTGENTLLLNQSAFSNWVAGGNNSFGATAKVKYEFDYKNGKNIWNNKIAVGYGQLSSEGEKPKKTDDIIVLESSYGYQISKNWYMSAASTFRTQIANGYDYGANPNYTPKDRKSAFMAPGYFTLGGGFEYKPNTKFQFSILPLTNKTTFVLDKKLQKKGNYGLENDGDWNYMELGALATIKYKATIMENVLWENYLTLFSNYLSHMERIDIAYATVVTMKVNNHISTKLTLDLIYAHNQIERLQLKETFGVGLSYNIKSKE